ncbi:hypothetical protein NsoK4_08825 [Nitrosopumilus sp. K4]|uniref:hypothetical protein n=1 Tax=Nitrosopumilus sp. K4 TaxID=2795383 RepID=UPI001BA82024|nr:hypothetical protein [Nitrosopumilus sp. K4]QUC64510.1 hypothetical protein NsoK4_08825 [Nitrosopumilus sp. K4]
MINKIYSKIIFIFSFTIIFFYQISVVFPALIIRSSSGTSIPSIDPFELGVFSIPFISINFIFFVTYVLFQKKKLRYFNSVLDILKHFDISKNKSLLCLIVILSVYIVFSYGEILEPEIIPDRKNVISDLEVWGKSDTFFENISALHTKLFFLVASDLIFENMRVIPFFASISLLIVSYFFTNKLTSKNYTGLISVLVIVQSYIFREYDTIITYSNFWTLFYVLSLYLIHKAWPLSSISYVLSFFAKPLTLMYFPLNILYILTNSETKKNKIIALIPYSLLFTGISILILFLVPASSLQPENFVWHPPKFFSGFTVLSYQLRYDLFIMMSLLPVSFLLYKKSQQGIKYADSFQILIAGILLTGPLLVGLLNYQLNPYRLQPFIVFFAIGVGLLFAHKTFRHNQYPST